MKKTRVWERGEIIGDKRVLPGDIIMGDKVYVKHWLILRPQEFDITEPERIRQHLAIVFLNDGTCKLVRVHAG